MATTDVIFSEAIAFLQAGRTNDAEKSLRKLLRRTSDHPLALSILGAILVGAGKHAESEPFLRSAVRYNPNAHAALYNHGLALKALGRADEALAQLTRALERAERQGIVRRTGGCWQLGA